MVHMIHTFKNSPKPWIIVISILVMALILSCLLSTEKVTYTLHGAEVDPEGNVIEAGTLSIEARIENHLFETSSFQLTGLELPGCQVAAIYESAYPLSEIINMPGNYHTFASVELSEYSSAAATPTDICFSEDHSLWIITVMGRIFVGTTDPDPDYAQIMDGWKGHIDSFN